MRCDWPRSRACACADGSADDEARDAFEQLAVRVLSIVAGRSKRLAQQWFGGDRFATLRGRQDFERLREEVAR